MMLDLLLEMRTQMLQLRRQMQQIRRQMQQMRKILDRMRSSTSVPLLVTSAVDGRRPSVMEGAHLAGAT